MGDMPIVLDSYLLIRVLDTI
ncbi:hypothetical protein LINPERPRIM_LOCUS41164 [Linum perenne]